MNLEKNLKPPHIIKATYRIVTPMFIGDAEQKASGISPQSVKGALRFWWRALMWGKIRTNERFNTDNLALKELHKQEAELFGSTPDEKTQIGGQGRFSLRVDFTQEPKTIRVNDIQGAGLSYFLGIGLSRESTRCALAAGQTFQVNLTYFDLKDHQANLIKALMLFGLVGGLGSRARKGWGSVTLESLTVGSEAIDIPHDINAYQAWLKTLINEQTLSQLPRFTAFSTKTRIDISCAAKSPTTAQSLLNEVGENQQLYRSYGQKGKVNGKSAEQNFSEDHDLVEKVIRTYRTVQPSAIPKRAIFGLPHNYYFSSTKGKADLAPAEPNRSRRASPLIIHAHQFSDKSVAIVQILMPAVFLPENTSLEYSMGKREQDKIQVTFRESLLDWKDITNYLNRFPERETI